MADSAFTRRDLLKLAGAAVAAAVTPGATAPVGAPGRARSGARAVARVDPARSRPARSHRGAAGALRRERAGRHRGDGGRCIDRALASALQTCRSLVRSL